MKTFSGEVRRESERGAYHAFAHLTSVNRHNSLSIACLNFKEIANEKDVSPFLMMS
jgi:hypothetical protein